MVRAPSSAAFFAVSAAIIAIQLYYSLDLQREAGTSTTTTTTASAAQPSASVADFQQILLTLVGAGGLYAAAALVYRSVRQAEAGGAAAGAGAGGGARRPSDLVAFLSAAVAVLEFFLFVDDVGAVGLAAAGVLPAASIASFFLGMVLIILVHIRAGGGAVDGDGPVQAPVWLVLVTKMAFAAGAGLVALMAIVLCAN